MDSNHSRLHVFVEGRVQGVGFRYFVVNRAEQYNLTGWVRNTRSGEVEVVAEGSRQMLEKLLVDVRRGPQGAFVTNTRVEWEDYTGSFHDFDVEHTV